MPERTIQGPDWPGEYGTAEQCAAFVGIERAVWLALEAAGLILPSGARLTRETVVWHWHSAIAVSLQLVPLMGKLQTWRKEQRKMKRTGPHSRSEGTKPGATDAH